MIKKILSFYGIIILILAVIMGITAICSGDIFEGYYGEEPSAEVVAFHEGVFYFAAVLIGCSVGGMILSVAFGEKNSACKKNSGMVGTYCGSKKYETDFCYIFSVASFLISVFSLVLLLALDKFKA